MNQDLTAMDLVSVEWDSDRESAVKFYKLKYLINITTIGINGLIAFLIS